MKSLIIRVLLRMLNSRFLNSSPCEYGFIGNIDAFSYANLASEEKQRPGITVKQILMEAAIFKACPLTRRGVTVIEDGAAREANAQDIRELQNLGGAKWPD